MSQVAFQVPEHIGKTALNIPAEEFFSVAQTGLLSDIVELQSREDFDDYMRSLEQKYYKQANVPEPPYEQMPEFPPKPYPHRKSKHALLRCL